MLAGGALQRTGESARERTDALFVVITDDRGLRLAHPDPTVLGQRVSTDPSGALAGNEVVESQRGTLGDSVRAKVPILALGSADVVIGEVSVGISTTAVRTELVKDLINGALVTGAVLLLGVLGSILLARRWKRLTLGLEPEELAELVREQGAEEQGGGEYRRHPVGRGPGRPGAGEAGGGQAPGDQQEDDQQAPVQLDVDARDAADADLAAHRRHRLPVLEWSDAPSVGRVR